MGEAPRGLGGAAVLGLGAALPDRVVDNEPIAARLGVDEHWIVKRLGVRHRHVLGEGERLGDLAAAAAERALDDAGVEAGEIDLVLVATTTQDELLPNTAPLVASLIGARGAGAFDVGAACTGFLSALAVAASHVETGRARHVLVVGADGLSRYLDQDDRRTAALIGDGAGAVVLGADSERRLTHFVLRSDDFGAPLVYMTRPHPFLHMEGEETFKFAVRALCDVTLEIVERAGLDLDDVDLFVYHQANARILRAVGERLSLKAERVVDCIEGTGNTSAASIPLALANAVASNRLREGDRVLLSAIGAGFTWGAGLVEWGCST